MKFTTKTRYGLRILCQLAENSSNSPVKSRELAERQNITEPYLIQIMLALKSAGFVNTVRGCNGGFVLARPADRITVLDIIENFEGKIEFADCHTPKGNCRMYDSCPSTRVWLELADVLKRRAGSITIAEIVKNNKSKKLEYVI